jgi:eukaryotic-like serine/threonine-protein kinase
VLDLRVQCLDAQRGTVDALVGALATASPEQLVLAAGASLPAVAECDLSNRPETKPRPGDPASRAQIAAIEKAIAEANAGINLGTFDRAAAAAERAIAAARKLGYEPLLAWALVRMGGVEKQRGSSKAAEKESGLDRAAKLLEEAYAVADAGRDERARLLAARELVEVHFHRGQYQAGALWARLGEGLLARLGSPPAEAAALAMNVGWTNLFTGRVPESKAAFRRAHAFALKVNPPDRRQLAMSQGTLCLNGEVAAEETACFRKALALALAAFGPGHPGLGSFYNNLAAGLKGQTAGHAEACELLRQALAVQRGSRDPTHPTTFRQATNLAGCLDDAGQVDEARRQFASLLALDARPSNHRAVLHEAYGRFLTDHGDIDEAVRYLRSALADFRTAQAPTDDDVLLVRLGLVLALVDQGRLAEARREIEEAIAACRKVGKEGERWAHLHTYRARVMQAEGRIDASLPALEEALRLHQRAGTVEEQLGMTLLGLGIAHLERGDAKQAVKDLERARKARAGVVELPVLRADIALGLAEALVREGGTAERERACALAGEAAASYRSLANKQRKRAAAERWLEGHRCLRLALGPAAPR